MAIGGGPGLHHRGQRAAAEAGYALDGELLLQEGAVPHLRLGPGQGEVEPAGCPDQEQAEQRGDGEAAQDAK